MKKEDIHSPGANPHFATAQPLGCTCHCNSLPSCPVHCIQPLHKNDVVVTDAPPTPETEDEHKERKALTFVLVQTAAALSNVTHALVEVLLYGPFDDDEGENTYWQKLEAAWTRFEACKRSLSELDMEVTIFEESVKVEMELMRETYQRSSGRGLLKLPVWVVCPDCRGIGAESIHGQTCRTCGGTGRRHRWDE